MKVEIIPKTLHFKQPAGTSRGVYTTRKVWYIVLTDAENPLHYGVGECAPLPALSCDDVPEYEDEPGIANLMSIMSAVTGKSMDQIQDSVRL